MVARCLFIATLLAGLIEPAFSNETRATVAEGRVIASIVEVVGLRETPNSSQKMVLGLPTGLLPVRPRSVKVDCGAETSNSLHDCTMIVFDMP